MAERRPERIDETEWSEALSRLAPISHSYLRRLLRGTGLPLAPLVEGVRQDTLEDLERTLLGLEGEYRTAVEGGDQQRTRTVRAVVIEAKNHAKWALRRAREKHADKQEMIRWMLTWLENPEAFPAWVGLRKVARSQQGGRPGPAQALGRPD